jgi:hypothetical protein
LRKFLQVGYYLDLLACDLASDAEFSQPSIPPLANLSEQTNSKTFGRALRAAD